VEAGTDQDSIVVADNQGEIKVETTEITATHTADQLDADTTAGGATCLRDSSPKPTCLRRFSFTARAQSQYS
jgi:hypothetical protein